MLYLRRLLLSVCSLFLLISPTWCSILSHFKLFGNISTQLGGALQSPTLKPKLHQSLHELPYAGFNLQVGGYQKNALTYISLQCNNLHIDPHHLEESVFQSISLGAGYRTLLIPSNLLGGYCFLDIASYTTSSTFNLNLGAEATFHLWRGHINGYIPLTYPYNKHFKLLVPETFTLSGPSLTHDYFLEQDYFLEKGNFNLDAKLVRERAFLNRITPAIGFYYFYNRYTHQHVFGGLFNIDYSLDDQWRVYFKLTHDTIRNYTFTIGCQWDALGGYNPNSRWSSQCLYLPHERHLASRFIKTKEPPRLLSPEEAEKWHPYDAYKAAQKEYERRVYSAQDEQVIQLKHAYDFLSQHSGESIKSIKEKTPEALAKWCKRNIAIKLYPKRSSSDEESTYLFQTYSQHMDTLVKAEKIPPTDRSSGLFHT